MNTLLKTIALAISLVWLSGCALEPQKLNVAPDLAFPKLQGVKLPVELVVKDNRPNKNILGYRNHKKEGPIRLSKPLEAAVGELMVAELGKQGITVLQEKPEEGAQFTRLQLIINKLTYGSPDEKWVNKIKMEAELQVSVSRKMASFQKRFSGHRSQDVATAPSVEFNTQYMNGLLEELINKAMNDREVVNFLR